MSLRPDVERRAMMDRLSRLRMDHVAAKSSDDESDGEIDLVTLIHNKCGDGVYDPSSRLSNLDGFQYARSRGRRKSKEFEDLLLHTATGSLRHSRQSISLRPRTSSSSSNKHQFLSLPSPTTARKTSTSNKPPPVTKPKRNLQRSKSDLSERVMSRKSIKAVEPRSPEPATGSKLGQGHSPDRGTVPKSPTTKKKVSRDKHSKAVPASPKLSPSKQHSVS